MRADLTRASTSSSQEGLEQGVIDRPVEIVFREVEGLPKGSVKAVIDAYGELVDEGCLLCSDRRSPTTACPTKEAIEERFHVPAISVTGTERLARRVDLLALDGLDDRRADLLGPPDRQARPRQRRRPRRAVAGRRDLHQAVPTPRVATRASASSPRSRSPRPPRTSASRCSEAARRRRRSSSSTAASGSASC